uniref:Uncharacterized protein n=1 Tax=Arundo donax TaxID=35708 RepID=A0A0A9D8Y6_ARUDO
MLPRPLIRTWQSVFASTRLREFPLGPSSRPTKLKLGYWSTGMSILIVFFTMKPEELPCGLSQFLDGGWNMPGPCNIEQNMAEENKQVETRIF